MNMWFFWAPLLVHSVFLLGEISTLNAERPLLIRGATLIDGTGQQPQPNINILIQGRIILAIGSDVAAPEGTKIMDARGKYVIPGLLDARVMLSASPANRVNRAEFGVEQRLQTFRALLRAGVTTVRLAQGDLLEHILYSRWMENDLMSAPRILQGGPTFTAPGGHPTEQYSMSGQHPRSREVREITNEEIARDTGRDFFRAGLQVLEVVYDSGPEDKPYPRLDDRALAMLVSDAHGYGVRAFCTVGRNSEAGKAIEAGADVIYGMWEEVLSNAVLAEMARRKVVFVPALSEQGDLVNLLDKKALDAYLAKPIVKHSLSEVLRQSLAHEGGFLEELRKAIEQHVDSRQKMKQQQQRGRENVRRAYAAGVQMAVGTSSGRPLVFPGAAVHRELELLVQAGLPPQEAILAATRNTAASLGLDKEVGTVEEGKGADLVILDANPLENIENTQRIHCVVHRGLVIYP